MIKINRVNSRFFGWNGWDFIKAGVLSVLVAAITVIMEMLTDGGDLSWVKVGRTVAIAVGAYLLKNLPPASSPLSTVPPVCEEPPVDYDTPAKPDNTPGA